MSPLGYAPAPYVAGTVTVPAGVVANLLDLIQAQISANCSGTAVEFLIQADPSNTGPVAFGAASSVAGPLTANNCGYRLNPTSPPRIYRSNYPGTSTPIGELQVFSAASAQLHVEVTG